MNNMTARIGYYYLPTGIMDFDEVEIPVGDFGFDIFTEINDGLHMPHSVCFYVYGKPVTHFTIPDSGYLILISTMHQMKMNGATEAELNMMATIIKECDCFVWEANNYKQFVQKMIEKYVDFI